MRNKGKPHILCVIYGTELYGSERGTLRPYVPFAMKAFKSP